MEINLLARMLEEKISFRMKEFLSLGQEVKEMYSRNEDPHRILELQAAMACIFDSLKPVEWIVREQYPQFNELFDSLKGIDNERILIINEPAES